MVHTFRVLFTGFRPFGPGTPRPPNPSGEAAIEIGRRRIEVPAAGGLLLSARLTTRVLDVLWTLPAEGGRPAQSGAADDIERAIDDVQPDIVIATGMAADKFRVERQAEDLDNPGGGYTDNNNRQPTANRREYPSEPLHRPTTLPYARIQAAWRRARIENFEESSSAGNFICEDVFYRVMRTAADPARQARGLRIHRAGFIHVPSSSYTTVARVVAAMEIAIVETMLDIPQRDYLPAPRVPPRRPPRRGPAPAPPR